MDIKRKACDIRTWKKTFISRHILTNIDTPVPSLYQCVETRSIEVFLTVFSATSAPPFQPLHQQNFSTFLNPPVNRFTRETVSTVNISV
jgi:hypothetical protein